MDKSDERWSNYLVVNGYIPQGDSNKGQTVKFFINDFLSK